MKTWVMVAAMVVGSLGAGPATRPAATRPTTQGPDVLTLQDIPGLLPADLVPDRRAGWTALEHNAANAWLAKHARGMTVKVSGVVDTFAVEGTSVSVQLFGQEFRINDVRAGASVRLTFAGWHAASPLRKLKARDRITAYGVIREVNMSAKGAAAPVPIGISLSLDKCAVGEPQ